ncbi:MAG: hypothetical protein H7343_04085 [Undibacterium sp.]|nr:hypothetical protein [Opitutaceae bacterium]
MLALGSALCAQPASTTFRPALVDSFSAGYTYSGSGDLSRGGVKTGEVALSRFDFSVSGRVPVREGLMFIPGLAYTHTTIDASAGVPLPGSVQELALSLGLRGFINREWAYLAALRPGFYGDFKKVGDGFNAPLLLAAFYSPSPELTWTFGVAANAFNDHPILPVVGVRWKFAPDWELDLGFPRTGVSYRMNSRLSLRTGLSFLGGNYRITENLGTPAPGVARLANTYLSLTEIRVGAGLNYNFADGLSLDFDAGVTASRRFDYPDRNYRLKGASVGWATLALNRRF